MILRRSVSTPPLAPPFTIKRRHVSEIYCQHVLLRHAPITDCDFSAMLQNRKQTVVYPKWVSRTSESATRPRSSAPSTPGKSNKNQLFLRLAKNLTNSETCGSSASSAFGVTCSGGMRSGKQDISGSRTAGRVAKKCPQDLTRSTKTPTAFDTNRVRPSTVLAGKICRRAQ